ncbi:MAG TPA: hypothetical protein VFU24_01615, partial [Burkholderiales bacterium]|nr:hypothetical protein [Burkholderiales bacterium]
MAKGDQTMMYVSRRRILAAALVAALPLAGAGWYLLARDPAPKAQHASNPQQLSDRVAGLAERMRESPQDAAGWAMLGRSY